MPAAGLAKRFQVHPNAIRHAHANEGTCNGFQIRRRQVRQGESFGRCRYVYRGIDESPSNATRATSNAPGKPATLERRQSGAIRREDAATGGSRLESSGQAGSGATEFMRQDDLASYLGAATKSVRSAWEKKSRLKGHRIERRSVLPDEDFGRVSFVFRAVPDPKATGPKSPVASASASDEDSDDLTLKAVLRKEELPAGKPSSRNDPDAPEPVQGAASKSEAPIPPMQEAEVADVETHGMEAQETSKPVSHDIEAHSARTMLEMASMYCLQHPEDATPVFRFLRACSEMQSQAS